MPDAQLPAWCRLVEDEVDVLAAMGKEDFQAVDRFGLEIHGRGHVELHLRGRPRLHLGHEPVQTHGVVSPEQDGEGSLGGERDPLRPGDRELVGEGLELVALHLPQAVGEREEAREVLDRPPDGGEGVVAGVGGGRRLAEGGLEQLLEHVALDLVQGPLVHRALLVLRNQLVDVDPDRLRVHEVLERGTDIGGDQKLSAVKPVLVEVVDVLPAGGDLGSEGGAQAEHLQVVDDARGEPPASQRALRQGNAFRGEHGHEGCRVVSVQGRGGRSQDPFHEREPHRARVRGLVPGSAIDQDQLTRPAFGRDGHEHRGPARWSRETTRRRRLSSVSGSTARSTVRDNIPAPSAW